MCGRFHNDFLNPEMMCIIKNLSVSEWEACRKGDVFPDSQAPVIVNSVNSLHTAVKKWGYANTYSRGLIINARSETAALKPIFSKDLALRRCVVPADFFYEWSADKRMHRFKRADGQLLYLCGIYGESDRFAILTKNSTEIVALYHDRIPVTVNEEQIRSFLSDDGFAARRLTNDCNDICLTCF